MSRRFPLTQLDRTQWQRLFDFAALVVLVCFLIYVGAETWLVRGMDFRGYYAAARVALAGGNPYDYRLVSRVLLTVTGEMGNNPYYYPPWFCLLIIPFVFFPFQIARLVWIVLNVIVFWLGAYLTIDALEWRVQGWRRWLVVLSAAYLFFWVSMRFEQLGTMLFALGALSLWAYRRKPWLAGIALALLLTKPNVTWLMAPCMGLLYWKRQRQAVWWALGTLAILLLVSTLALPGWYRVFTEPGFGVGLTMELDGPDRVNAVRLSTVLSDWLRQWGIQGAAYWVIWGVLALGSVLALWLAWHHVDDPVYLLSLASAVGLLLTPYALQYDYPPLILALFWIWRALPNMPHVRRWIAGATLAFVLVVPLWERPAYDGYWILLGISIALLLNNELWRPLRSFSFARMRNS